MNSVPFKLFIEATLSYWVKYLSMQCYPCSVAPSKNMAIMQYSALLHIFGIFGTLGTLNILSDKAPPCIEMVNIHTLLTLHSSKGNVVPFSLLKEDVFNTDSSCFFCLFVCEDFENTIF